MDLDRFYFSLTNSAGLAPATVRHVHAVIRRALRQAVVWGWIGINPAVNATLPRLVKADISPPSPEQVLELIQKAHERDPELGNFLHIAASTGARRGEVCAIRWSNLDVKKKTLVIERAIIDMTGEVIEKDTKTHANRRMQLDPDTFAVFENQRSIAQDRAAQVGMKIAANAYVFSREPDGLIPWTPGRVTKQFQSVRDALGYDNVRLHDLRHFAATRLMAAGIPVRTVSGRLGHANPSTTLSIYTHFVEASDQDAAMVMGKLLAKKKPKPATKKATKLVARKSTGD
jgi:integrase